MTVTQESTHSIIHFIWGPGTHTNTSRSYEGEGAQQECSVDDGGGWQMEWGILGNCTQTTTLWPFFPFNMLWAVEQGLGNDQPEWCLHGLIPGIPVPLSEQGNDLRLDMVSFESQVLGLRAWKIVNLPSHPLPQANIPLFIFILKRKSSRNFWVLKFVRMRLLKQTGSFCGRDRIRTLINKGIFAGHSQNAPLHLPSPTFIDTALFSQTVLYPMWV